MKISLNDGREIKKPLDNLKLRKFTTRIHVLQEMLKKLLQAEEI